MEDVDYQMQFDPQTIKNEAAGTAYLQEMVEQAHEAELEGDHTQAIRTNQLFDTLQRILDESEEPRADLRAEYEDYRKEEAASLGLDWPPQWPPC